MWALTNIRLDLADVKFLPPPAPLELVPCAASMGDMTCFARSVGSKFPARREALEFLCLGTRKFDPPVILRLNFLMPGAPVGSVRMEPGPNMAESNSASDWHVSG